MLAVATAKVKLWRGTSGIGIATSIGASKRKTDGIWRVFFYIYAIATESSVRRNPAFFRLIPYSPVQLTALAARASRRQFTRQIALRPDSVEGQGSSPPHIREL